MNNIAFNTKFLLLLLACQLLFAACNKDEVINGEGLPTIVLDGDGSGVYVVKVGGVLTISPSFKNATDASYAWSMDGKTVCTAPEWTHTWSELGDFYVVLTVTTSAGRASEELKIEVVDKDLPVIRLAVPDGGYTMGVGSELLLVPEYENDDIEPFSVEWQIDGKTVGTERSYTFRGEKPGAFNVAVIANNGDGSSCKEFVINVLEYGDYKVVFEPVMWNSPSTTRFTFAGRPVFLEPSLVGFDNPSFIWTVNGQEIDNEGRYFVFTPSEAGTYNIEVAAKEKNDKGLVVEIKAVITVECVAQSEVSRRRPASSASSMFSTQVFSYIPAPGQFVGESEELQAADEQAAIAWAQKTLEKRNYVSLGSFGGFMVVGFDHSVGGQGAEYDFAIEGNSFIAKHGASNEPGIVWVMQDVNGNGLPDDEWYQLKGSEFDNDGYNPSLSVTYYRPEAPASPVEWSASDGARGSIDYMSVIHPQPFYYPSWIETSSYVLSGPMLKPRNHRDDDGFWANPPYDWGYADNVGSDSFQATIGGVEGQFNGFKLSNAILPDGQPVSLQYVDFVKVQNAVLAKSGPLGEVSTEVLSVADYSLMPK